MFFLKNNLGGYPPFSDSSALLYLSYKITFLYITIYLLENVGK